MGSRLSGVLAWVGRTGDESEDEWARAVLAEAEVLPVGLRRAWLLGGVWFALMQRRPHAVQVASAWVGVLYAGLWLYIAWTFSPLVEDAPDMPMGAAVVEIIGAAVLGLTFLVASVRPLVGLVVATAGLPVWWVAEFAATQMTRAWATRGDQTPPLGMDTPDVSLGVVGYALALLVTVGVPVLAMVGAVMPSLMGTAARPRGPLAETGAGAQ